MKSMLLAALIIFITLSVHSQTDKQELSQLSTQIDAPLISKWKFGTSLSVPFRGFEIKSKLASENPASIKSVSYNPGPSLEGDFSLAYENLGFNYRHTLANSSLDSKLNLPSSVNEEFRFNLFYDRKLLEFSTQRLVGLKTNTHARPDISYSDVRMRAVYALPLWGAEIPNSLANFYSKAEMPKGDDLSVDLIFDAEILRQSIAANSPLVPDSSLVETDSQSLGAGAGFGLTQLMGPSSYFSIAALLGGNYNFSRSRFNTATENTSGFGAYMIGRMSVQYAFGSIYKQNIGFKLLVDSWTMPVKDHEISSMDSSMALSYEIVI